MSKTTLHLPTGSHSYPVTAPDTAPATTVPCPYDCRGTGKIMVIYGWSGSGPMAEPVEAPCLPCHGTGRVPVEAA